MTLSKTYRPATWNNTTEVDMDLSAIGIGLGRETGTLLRLRLTARTPDYWPIR